MEDKLIYIPNDKKLNYTFCICRLELSVEKFRHYYFGANLSKSNESTQDFDPIKKITW